MSTRIIGQLHELGLSASEAKVYLALLEIGQTTAGDLIRRTQLHRAIVYESLDRLIDKKLAAKVLRQKVAHFQANDPDRLLQRVRSQQTLAEELIPRLHTIAAAKTSEIAVYEGLEGYRRFWLESVERMPAGSIDYVAGSVGKRWLECMGPDYERYERIRTRKKIVWQMIVFDRDEWEESLMKSRPALNQFRLITRDIPAEGSFNVFNEDTVVLQSINEPLIIEVRNPPLARVFKNIFDVMWASGKPL